MTDRIENGNVMGLTTSLYENHLQQKAKMVDFAGWDMPIQYSSVIEEHQAVRNHAGMFDVSHMLSVDIVGKDAKKYIAYLLANDINKVKKGKAFYSCMLNEAAGIVDDLITYYLDDETIRIVVNAGNRQSDVQWMKAQAKGYEVAITPREDLSIIAIQGPQARAIVNEVLADKYTQEVKTLKPFSMVNVGQWMIARTGYTGEDGYEISLPNTQAQAFWDALLAKEVKPCGLAARDTLRLEAGMNLYGQDMNCDTTPIESALMWTVKLSDEREFVGKAALSSKKAQINEQLAGLVLLDRGVLRHGQKVIVSDSEQTGVVTSGTFSPTLGESIALARVPKGAQEISVEIRGKEVPAKIVKFPFVRNGKKIYSEI